MDAGTCETVPGKMIKEEEADQVGAPQNDPTALDPGAADEAVHMLDPFADIEEPFDVDPDARHALELQLENICSFRALKEGGAASFPCKKEVPGP